LDRSAFKKTAKEDWTSDAADAFRYVAMAWKEIVKVPEPKKKPLFVPLQEITMDEWTSFGRKERRERARLGRASRRRHDRYDNQSRPV
jgi:hypothetical protein